MTISKPMGSRQAQTYYRDEHTQTSGHFVGTEVVPGTWHGILARELGLDQGVDFDQFHRLAGGRHPITDTILVHNPVTRKNSGFLVHRAGWDFTFSAPKSISITGLVGGDPDIRRVHREAVLGALELIEPYTQAHMGGTKPRLTTGQFLIARFEHETSRRLDPAIHDHCFCSNLTLTPDGKSYAIDPLELFRCQKFATAAYRTYLALHLQMLGYPIVIEPKTGAPEIQGYCQEYLQACSQRSREIEQSLRHIGVDRDQFKAEHRSFAGVAQYATYQSRVEKQSVSRDQIRQNQLELARQFGDQPVQIVANARRTQPIAADQLPANEIINQARHLILHQGSAIDVRTLLTGCLNRNLGKTSVAAIRTALQTEVEAGRLIKIPRPGLNPFPTLYSTPEIGMPSHSIQEPVSSPTVQPSPPQVFQITSREKRYREITSRFLVAPDQSLVVCPDHRARQELNRLIRNELIQRGQIEPAGQMVRILTPRDLNVAQRGRAKFYQVGDVIYYRRGTKKHNLQNGIQAVIRRVDPRSNLLTVALPDQTLVQYQPDLTLRDSEVYQIASRELAMGDRIQFLRPYAEHHIKKYDFGIVQSINGNKAAIATKNRTVEFDFEKSQFIDYGYCVESLTNQSKFIQSILVNSEHQNHTSLPVFSHPEARSVLIFAHSIPKPDTTPQSPSRSHSVERSHSSLDETQRQAEKRFKKNLLLEISLK